MQGAGVADDLHRCTCRSYAGVATFPYQCRERASQMVYIVAHVDKFICIDCKQYFNCYAGSGRRRRSTSLHTQIL
jgi:hypothetical protein